MFSHKRRPGSFRILFKVRIVEAEGRKALVVMRSYIAVTISRKQETFSLEIPFFCYTETNTFNRYRDQREETYYVCEKRNRAMAAALERYPSATHVLSVDSYYLNQAA